MNDMISVKSRVAKNAEDVIVPAHNLKKPIDFNLVDDQDFSGGIGGASDESLSMHNIATTLRPMADAILPFLGEEATCKLFARNWQLRE